MLAQLRKLGFSYFFLSCHSSDPSRAFKYSMKFCNLLKWPALSVSVPQSGACSHWLAAILAAKGARKDQALEVAEVLKTENV